MKENKIGGLPVAEHILVGLSSAPSNARIIRTAATMAEAFGGTFTALFVRTPNYEALSEENKERLRQNTALAQELGATIAPWPITMALSPISSRHLRMAARGKVAIFQSAASSKGTSSGSFNRSRAGTFM